jgi:hypothetical protein
MFATQIMTSITGFVEQEKEFWDGETPKTGDLRRRLNREMKSRRLLVPPRNENPRRAGLLATAASFFSGLLAGGSIVHVLRWIRKLDEYLYFAGKHNVNVDLVGCFMRIFNVLIGRLDRKKGVKTWRNRELLARVLLYISEAEAASRSGSPEHFPSVEGIPENLSLEVFRRWIEGKTDDSMVEECLQLASALQEIIPAHGTDIRHNPVFGEFGVIEEAEGDLYVDCTLYKIEIVDSVKNTTVRQLMGCCVMNRLNEVMPSIERIGLVNPRRGFRWEEDVNEVCLMVGTGSISELTRNIAKKLLELASPEQRLVTMDHVG